MAKEKKKSNKFILIYIVLVVALLVVIYLLPKMNDQMTKTMMVEHGTLAVSDSESGYIVRKEVVYTAGDTGKPTYKVKEGTKVRKTAKIMSVKKTGESDSPKYSKLINMLDNMDVRTTKYKAGINGVLSYSVDGYEGILTTDKMLDIEQSQVNDLVDDFTDLKRDKVVEGEPVYKVYDNSKWYMLIWTDAATAETYEKGSTVTIRFKDADITAKVYKKKRLKSNSYRIILESDRYYENLAVSRAEKVEIITRECEGVIVDNTAIVQEDGKDGIYVRNAAGEYIFTPVNILLSNHEQSVISERVYYDAEGKQVNTVDIYDEILRNP